MKTTEYFFECYFNMSADYNEIDKLVEEFNTIECEEYIDQLKQELSDVIKSNDWKTIIQIASNKGGRKLTENKAQLLINYILAKLEGKSNQ